MVPIQIDFAELGIFVLAAFAGGAFGAALGALPAFIFTGFMVIAGEVAAYVDSDLGAITSLIAFGPPFSPAISFAGGAAAAAYAAKKGYMDTGFDYYEAKNIAYALGTKPDVLVVGGVFGIFGYLVTELFATFLLPFDSIAAAVVVSAIAHRLAFGYDLIGPHPEGLMDMSPFEEETPRGEYERVIGDSAAESEVETDGGAAHRTRFLVEPWLPHQYKWANVVMIGLVVGLLAAYIALVTGSQFLAFGISAATLLFLNCGVDNIPVTHHMSLPASTAAIAMFPATATPELGFAPLLVGALFGILGALAGEVVERIFYAHADTHLDPPAAGIAVGSFVIALLAIVGVFPQSGYVPTFGLVP